MVFKTHPFLPHKYWRNRKRRVHQKIALRFISREVPMAAFIFHPP